MNESLQKTLKKLRLSGMTRSLNVRLQEAAGNGLNHMEFLELILQDELLVRNERQIQRRVKVAAFRELRTLEDFDWQFNPSIKKKQIYDLATCQFIEKGLDVCWLGPPGTGKSHLCQAIAYRWPGLRRPLTLLLLFLAFACNTLATVIDFSAIELAFLARSKRSLRTAK